MILSISHVHRGNDDISLCTCDDDNKDLKAMSKKIIPLAIKNLIIKYRAGKYEHCRVSGASQR